MHSGRLTGRLRASKWLHGGAPNAANDPVGRSGRRSTERQPSVRPHRGVQAPTGSGRGGDLRPAQGRRAVVTLPVDVGLPGRPLRSDLRDRGQFRRIARCILGPVEATLADHLRPMLRCCKRPADNDGPAYDAVTRPDSARGGRRLSGSAERCAPASFIRATEDLSGSGFYASGIFSWPSGASLRKRARQRQTRIVPFRRNRSTQGCATQCRGCSHGWRKPHRLGFPGPKERQTMAGCSLSCSQLSSVFRFPAWRWHLSPQPGGSRA